MANVKALGVVLLIGALTALLVVRHVRDSKTAHHDQDWHSWKAKYGSNFGAHEESIRQNMFQKHSKWVAEHNSKNNTYEVETNHLSVYTDEEFAALFLGDDEAPVNEENIEFLELDTAAASSIDWTTKGAVTGVKNQGSCGSCWSFSATGALEGFKAVKDGKLVSFSEQQLVDCSGSYGNNGCSGGLALRAFDYVKANGIVEGSAYSYKAKQGSCSIPASAGRFKISGWSQVPVGNIAQMQAALTKQPCAVSVKADSNVFRSYKSGILNSAECGTATNHAVLAVGYVSGQYWKVKNSWGTSYGQSGYVNIAMKDGEGICGINKRVTYTY